MDPSIIQAQLTEDVLQSQVALPLVVGLPVVTQVSKAGLLMKQLEIAEWRDNVGKARNWQALSPPAYCLFQPTDGLLRENQKRIRVASAPFFLSITYIHLKHEHVMVRRGQCKATKILGPALLMNHPPKKTGTKNAGKLSPFAKKDHIMPYSHKWYSNL